MPEEKPPDQKNEKEEKPPCTPGSFPLRPAGEVVLAHHEAPPPSGKQRIHQRRPLPQVPDKPKDDQDRDDQDRDEQDPQDPNNR